MSVCVEVECVVSVCGSVCAWRWRWKGGVFARGRRRMRCVVCGVCGEVGR